MYRTMFDTQSQWGEQQVPLDDLFASYAADLGLDMTQFQADYTSSATRARIDADLRDGARSEEHTSELQSLMRISYAVFCLKKKKSTITKKQHPKNNLKQ